MSLFDLVVSAIFSIAIFLGITLIIERNQSPFRQELLGLSLLIIGLNFAYVLFNNTGLLLRFPFLLRLLSPFLYLVGPLFYLFFLSAFRENTKLKWMDSLHFLPAFFHFLELLPFYFLDIEAKRSLALSIKSDVYLLFRQGGGWIPIIYHYVIRVVLGFVYAGLIFNKLRFEQFNKTFSSQMRPLRNIAYFYSCLVLVLSIIFVVSMGYFSPVVEKYSNLFLVNFIVLVLLSGFGLLSIRQLHSSTGNQTQEEKTDKISLKDPIQDLPGHSFSDSEVQILGKRIQSYCESGSYKNPHLRLGDLAGYLKIPERDLNAVIQKNFGMKFNDLLKEYRVEEAKRLIENDTAGIWTLDSLGLEAGFPSRSSFFKVFKEKTGLTPKKFQENYRS